MNGITDKTCRYTHISLFIFYLTINSKIIVDYMRGIKFKQIDMKHKLCSSSLEMNENIGDKSGDPYRHNNGDKQGDVVDYRKIRNSKKNIRGKIGKH